MTVRSTLLAVLIGASPIALHIIDPHVARAQDATSGAIQGVVVDKASKDPLPGVTVVVTSPAVREAQTTLTDDKGSYKVSDLPPGEYLVTFYFADITVEHSGVTVGVNKTVPVYQAIDQSKAGGEVVHVQGTPPPIDPNSTNQGITLDKNYLKNIPVPGRTFDQMLGAAAGSQGDPVTGGVSFSGSTSLENEYIVDGVNTTGLTYGTVASPIINDFVEEIEVITGGYDAEYGHSTGGVVQVVTKSGSNEFKGSVFGTYQPGFLTAPARVSPVNATSIDATANTAYYADFGFEIGGPIIKDKLWFYAGFAPMFNSTNIIRTVKSQTDCRIAADPSKGIPSSSDVPGMSTCQSKYADGVPDIDPRTGFYITTPVDTETRVATAYTYNALAKINYAPTPEHQGQISFSALPSGTKTPGIYGPAAAGTKSTDLSTDLSAKWTSKFNDNKTEVEAIVAWHRDHDTFDALNPADPNYGDQQPSQILENGSLGVWGPAYGESAKVNSYTGGVNGVGCKDGNPGSPDPYPLITNCPMNTRSYVIGGPGGVVNDTEQRKMAELNITHRLKFAGTHEFKAGFEIEDQTQSKARIYSGNASTNGGSFITNDVNDGLITTDRWVQLAPMGSTDPRFNQSCSDQTSGRTFQCAYLGGTVGSPGTQISGSEINWAAYVRDSWQIRPNLTVNVGIRYEEQYLRYANFLQDTIDPLTGNLLGKDAMALKNNWAPRVGILWDPTKEGRSKIYAHWGRFYETIPMDINERSFGGEVTYEQEWSAKACGNQRDPNIGGVNGLSCAAQTGAADQTNYLIGANGVLVAPGIKSEYMDEIVAGFEYEIMDDLKVGFSYENRNFGRIIEDVSTDGAQTYIVSNPSEWSTSEQNQLEQQIARTDDPATKARLQNELTEFEGIRMFDKPSRDYNALTFTVTRRFSKALYVQGSYTYSRTEGNYPGSVSYDNGQVDPNISSEFDLIELLSNRLGALPQDRPHYLKLDGYYTFDLKKAGDLTVGIRFRALSGTPENALAGHYLYGPNESFLLPRGELGRTDFDHGLDIHAGWGKKLNKNMTLEVYVDVFNVYDRQGTAAVDTTYAPYYSLEGTAGAMAGTPAYGIQQNANPVSGGTYSDLIWVKELDQNGQATKNPIGRNPDFGNTVERYAPLNARIGARLSF